MQAISPHLRAYARWSSVCVCFSRTACHSQQQPAVSCASALATLPASDSPSLRRPCSTRLRLRSALYGIEDRRPRSDELPGIERWKCLFKISSCPSSAAFCKALCHGWPLSSMSRVAVIPNDRTRISGSSCLLRRPRNTHTTAPCLFTTQKYHRAVTRKLRRGASWSQRCLRAQLQWLYLPAFLRYAA